MKLVLVGWRNFRWFALLLVTVSVFASSARYQLDDFTSIDFDELKGQWVILSYWAIWCPPCRDEVKILNEIHSNRNDLEVVVLGVNFDGVQGIKLREQKRRFEVEYQDLLTDPGPRWNLTKPGFIPRTVIIDKDGKLHDVFDGVSSRRKILKSIGAKM